jgi:hypothetical protein
VAETSDAITLQGRVIIETDAASFRSIRGYSLAAALLAKLRALAIADAARCRTGNHTRRCSTLAKSATPSSTPLDAIPRS